MEKYIDSESEIYDWNAYNASKFAKPSYAIQIHDETLRDGLQSPSVSLPKLQDQFDIMALVASLPIDSLTIGFPCVSKDMYKMALESAKEVARCQYSFNVGMTGRTVLSDIDPIIDIVNKTGVDIEAQLFIGSSNMRRNIENWTIDDILRMTEQSVTYAKKHHLRVIYITEDTTRTHPALLEKLYLTAASCGADWINVCDTVGHVTPDGIYALIQFIRNSLNENGYQHVHIDFHGHMDRGLGLWNSIAALAAGASRVQACALGIGERCGNTPMEQLLVNLKLMQWLDGDLKNLTAYVDQVAKAFHIEIPSFAPVVGENAFLTATGVHAAAIVKALEKKQYSSAENVYSSVPASWIGRENEIKIGPFSGKWNVIHWLKKNNIAYTDEMINILLTEAKKLDKIMTDTQILSFIKNNY